MIPNWTALYSRIDGIDSQTLYLSFHKEVLTALLRVINPQYNLDHERSFVNIPTLETTNLANPTFNVQFARMIVRNAQSSVETALKRQAAVAIIGPRQIGKTTLALQIAEGVKSLYLDLESPEDRAKLADPLLFLRNYEDSLVVLDEIHRVPELFQPLRGLIDEGRRRGHRTGRFLILGSAAIDLLRQSGETLAGRISYIDMGPLNVSEAVNDDGDKIRLWVRGGFPDAFLAASDEDSIAIRNDFIRTYLERDVPQFGPRIPAETLRRLWTMLAHNHGTLLNSSKLATSLNVSTTTVTRYIDLLTDLLLVRRLQPFHANTGKRLVKSPKVYVRDSGLLHALLGIPSFNELSGHPIVGTSWEGFVIENILSVSPPQTQASFYRTSAGAEIDLVLEIPGAGCWAIEIKRGLVPRIEKGFYIACDDILPDRRFVVYGGTERYPLDSNTEAIGLSGIVNELRDL